MTDARPEREHEASGRCPQQESTHAAIERLVREQGPPAARDGAERRRDAPAEEGGHDEAASSVKTDGERHRFEKARLMATDEHGKGVDHARAKQAGKGGKSDGKVETRGAAVGHRIGNAE